MLVKILKNNPNVPPKTSIFNIEQRRYTAYCTMRTHGLYLSWLQSSGTTVPGISTRVWQSAQQPQLAQKSTRNMSPIASHGVSNLNKWSYVMQSQNTFQQRKSDNIFFLLCRAMLVLCERAEPNPVSKDCTICCFKHRCVEKAVCCGGRELGGELNGRSWKKRR